MNPDADRLFELASQLPADQRQEFLARECPDPVLRDEVTSLLQYATPESFFDDVVQCAASSLRRDAKLPAGDPAVADRGVSLIGHICGRTAVEHFDPTAFQGRQLGHYRLDELVGGGGMGDVFRACNLGLEMKVAVKIITPRSPVTQSRLLDFQREWLNIGQIKHENVVSAMDAGEAEGVFYLVMEWLDGTDLGKLLLRNGPFHIMDVCSLIAQAARGLMHIHEHNLVHRDVKPSNLFLTSDGLIKILDLGIAATAFDSRPAHSLELPAELSLCGTVDYMSPEQWDAPLSVGPKADVYALGCTFYELLEGHPPFAAGSHVDVRAKRDAHRNEHVRLSELACGVLPRPVGELLEAMLAKKSGQRPTAVQVTTTLEQISGETLASAQHVVKRRNPRRRQSDMEQLVHRLGACEVLNGELRLCEYHDDRADVRLYEQNCSDQILSENGKIVRIARTPSLVSLVAQMQHKTEVAGHWGLMARERQWLTDRLTARFRSRSSGTEPCRILQCGIAGHVHFAGNSKLILDALDASAAALPITLVTIDKCCGPILISKQLLKHIDAHPRDLQNGDLSDLDVMGRIVAIDPTLRPSLDAMRKGGTRIFHELIVGDVTDSDALLCHGPFDIVLSHFLLNMWIESTIESVQRWSYSLRQAMRSGADLLIAVDPTILRNGVSLPVIRTMLEREGIDFQDQLNVWDVYDLDFSTRKAFLQGSADFEVSRESVLMRFAMS